MNETIEFLGETFTIADKVSSLAFMRFAKVAKEGVDAADIDGMAALYDLLEQCIAAEEWRRFEKHADKERADGDELLKVVQGVFAIMAERPTVRSSDSSDGPQTTGPSSTDGSSSREAAAAQRVIDRYNAQGRPDLALVVRKKQEQQLTA